MAVHRGEQVSTLPLAFLAPAQPTWPVHGLAHGLAGAGTFDRLAAAPKGKLEVAARSLGLLASLPAEALAGAVVAAAAFGARRSARRRAAAAASRTSHRAGVRMTGPCSYHGGAHLSAEAKAQLERVCAAVATPGKGITACDEGAGTIGARFEKVGVENTEEQRRVYRQMLFETPGINEFLSAAILDPETMYQKNDKGVPFPESMKALGIIPGVKPHLKVYELPGTGGETVMQGLDSLAVRCREYKAAGAQFAKWRSPIMITDTAPSDLAIESNMRDLARYALICQDEGLVPIVEPDVVMKGTHDLETAVAVNVKVQASLYKAMLDHGVYMEGTILKTNMVNPGLSCPTSYSAEQIGAANITTLRRVMPVAIPGVNFLSGGQNLEDAAARLNAINKAKGNSPWNLSFSWSAALQMPLFDLCIGKGGAVPIADMGKLYLAELRIAAAAAKGEHKPKDGEGAHLGKKQLVAA